MRPVRSRSLAVRVIRALLFSFLALIATGAFAPTAEASHWRGGSIWYEVDEGGRITIDMLNLYGNFVGNTWISMPRTTEIRHDRLSLTGRPTRTTFATAHDRNIRQIDNPSQYSPENPFVALATFQSSARISGILNQPTSWINLNALIVWEGPGTVSHSPRLDAPLDRIVAKAQDPSKQTDWHSDLNAIHPDGLGMTFTLMERNGTDGFGPRTQIPGFSIDQVTGRMSIAKEDIQGLGTNPYNPGGDWHFRVRVQDSRGGFAIRDVLLGIVTTDNEAPTISSGGDRSVRVGQTLTFTVRGSDPDGDRVSLSASGLPAGATFVPGPAGTSTSGTFTFTPTESQVGQVISVRFDATDDGSPNLLASETVAISVSGDNLAPKYDFIGNQSLFEVSAGSAVSFTATATDPNPGDVLSHSMTFFRRNDGQVNETQDNSVAGLTFDTSTGAFRWEPTAADIGTHRIALRVTDDGAPPLSDTSHVYISVGPVNQSPSIDALPTRVTVLEGQPVDLTIRAVDPDDGDTVAITADNTPFGSTLTPVRQGRVAESVFSWTPPAGTAGIYQVTFAARDDGDPNLTERRAVEIVVAEPGGSPTITSILPGTVSRAGGHTITIDGSNFDGSVDVELTGPFGTRDCTDVVVSGDGLSLTCTTPDVSGVADTDFLADVTITVDRGNGDVQSVDRGDGLRFRDPRPAVAFDLSVTTSEGAARTFTFQVSNPDGGPLTFSAAVPPTNGTVTVDDATRTATYTPAPDFFGGVFPASGRGTDSFTYQVCTAANLCSTATVTVTVSVVNLAPVAFDLEGFEATEGLFVDIPLSGTDRETVAEALTFVLAGAPAHGSVSILGGTARYHAPPPETFLGAVTFTYRAVDGFGLVSEPATVSLLVVPDNIQEITSEGEGNEQTAEQDGRGNEQIADASGDDNTQDLSQSGDDNVQSGTAQGNENDQTQTQTGTDNDQSAGASGNGNDQDLDQVGDDNVQSGSTTGNGNTQDQDQDGSDNIQTGSADGDGNVQDQDQSGTGGSQSADAGGGANHQDQSQQGDVNTQGATTTGDGNSQSQDQVGTGNQQGAGSTGDGNLQDQGQDGDFNEQAADAEGDANAQDQVQSGNDNDQDASADGNGNVQDQDQSGDDNDQSAEAEGNGNAQVQTQLGDDNTQASSADGDGNTQWQDQSGVGNDQSSTATGNDNTQDLVQLGDDNDQNASAEGDDIAQTLTQEGSGNTQSTDAVGTDIVGVLTQQGDDNDAQLTQDGTSLTAEISQTGDGSSVSASQTGTDLDLNVSQDGDGLGLVVTQDGSGNRLDVRGDVLTPSDADGPLLSFEQDPGQSTIADVTWTSLAADLAGAGNAIRIHYGPTTAETDALITLTVSSPGDAASQASIDFPTYGDPSAPSPTIVRFEDFLAAGTAPADFASVDAIGIRVASDGGLVTIRYVEVIRVIDTLADIKPGSNPSAVNVTRANGVVPALLFGSAELDVAAVDPASLDLLGMPVATRGNGAWKIELEDADGDGHLDARIHFERSGWSLPAGATEQDMVIAGLHLDGSVVIGTNPADDPVKFTSSGRKRDK